MGINMAKKKRKASGLPARSAASRKPMPRAKKTGRRPDLDPRHSANPQLPPPQPHAPGPISSDEDCADVPEQALPAFAVVGLGASAGGLEALGQLLHALPPRPGIALVVVQHMAPRAESMLPHLLAGASNLPVSEVIDGMRVEMDHVYVIPPNTEMGISKGCLHLMPRPDSRMQFNPIDYFFDSLASFAQGRAIGVILSGTASDGAIGLREIKVAGGIAIAQEPGTAKYDGMPRAAIATGVIDLVLAPAAIAGELVRLGQQLLALPSHEPLPPVAAPPPPATSPSHALGRIFTILRKSSGVDFSHYKMPTVQRRLHRRMVLHKVTTLEQYVRVLEENNGEVAALYQDILIHVTRFFRDAESFRVLESTVFPAIIEPNNASRPVRIWVPGCSTGEEAYSVAMAVLEFLGDEGSATPIQIFATDVSESAIERARAGVYPVSISADVTPERLRRFFNRADGNYRINKTVRDLCIFARQDLTHDPPFSKLDLIVCRNVLIYFDTALQKKLMQVFHYALRSEGFLMLGGAEGIGTHIDLFATVDKKYRLYARKANSGIRADVDFTMAEHRLRDGGRRGAPELARTQSNVQSEANRILLNRFTPPGVIVDGNWKIIQFRGQTGSFLEPAPGDANLDLLKMAREGLLYGLRTALYEARKKDRVARKEGLRVKIGGHMQEIDVEVVPLTAAEGRHFLVLFQERSHGSPAEEPAAERPARGKAHASDKAKKPAGTQTLAKIQQQQRLKQELAASREYLQSIIQDLEAANEELQSANEEILSSNEELQSTNEELDTAKEELQSTNEELNTVNEELQGRNEELSRVNSDLVNLLGSVQIAIVIVAGDLRIRRFTPMAEKVLNLIPGDVGRPISDIKPNIDCPELEQLIHEAIDTMTIKEREVRDRHKNWFMLRIRPYKNVENRIDGAVLALFDVDKTHRQEAQNAVAPEALGALMEALDEPVVILDAKHIVRAANSVFTKQMKMGDVLGLPISELSDGRWKNAEVHRLIEAALERNGDAEQSSGEGDGSAGLILRARKQMIGGEALTLVVFGPKEVKTEVKRQK
jgi:two-component system CheB/CheR fusion protein